MAQAKATKVVKTGYTSTGALVVNSNAPTVNTLPANTMAGLASYLKATIGTTLTQSTNTRLVRSAVQYINGWPNGQPVQGALPLVINGVPYTGNMAASNPLANPAKLAAPFSMVNGNKVVKLVALCPGTSKNASNAACGNAVNAALANGTTLTLNALGALCITAQGGNAANVAAWLGYACKKWLKPA